MVIRNNEIKLILQIFKQSLLSDSTTPVNTFVRKKQVVSVL